ncbi:MAG TPA: energy transducer TonB, partial [Bacteroidia bacterium]|nr:energy transducer TonB [Bacteroidia bacterium]
NPVPHVVDEDGPEEVFAYVQEMPGFPGGPYALQKFLAKNIRYPEMEKENGVQGTVFVSFTVMKDGTVGDVKVVKGVPGGPGLGKEAVRVISQMPAWAPGKQNGRAVNVRMMQPVKFVLQ